MNLKNFNFMGVVSRICGVLLAVLGFGCSSSDGPDGPLMYGTPTGSFEIKGHVMSEDGKAVEKATMRVTDPQIPSGVYSSATAYTDFEGNYMVAGTCFLDKMKVVCIPDDNRLEPDSVEVELKFIRDKDDENIWYMGKATATVDFNLKKRAEE